MPAFIPVNTLRSGSRLATRSAGVVRTTQFARVGTSSNEQNQQLSSRSFSRQHRYHHSSQRNRGHRVPYSSIPVLSFFFPSFFGAGSDETPDLTPFKYTTHRVLSIKRISPQHVVIDIQISQRSKDAFSNHGADGHDSTPGNAETLDIWHVYAKSPDLQIERPYTPINDVQKDGYIRLLVKRVKGGEVGRYLHSLNEGDDIEIRGPIKTVSLPVQSLDHLTMISTGTGVAPFLQLICKLAHAPAAPSLTDNSTSSSLSQPKLCLIQYLPRNSHATTPAVPLTGTPPRSISDSLPAEEFSDADSTLEAGPDIIRHPDVFSPAVRKHLVDAGVLRLLRVRAGQHIDQSMIVDSLTASQKPVVPSMSPESEAPADTGEKGSWLGWFSSPGRTPSSDTEGETSAADLKLRDGKIGDSRVGVMACLPVQSLIPLAGPQYPIGRTKPPIAGVLGSMGFNRDNVWIL